MTRLSKMRPGIAGLQSARSIAIEANAEIRPPVIAEAVDGLAGARVDRREISRVDIEQPPIRAILALPIIHTASSHSARVRMDPQFLPVAASSATKELFFASTYITPSTTIGPKL